MEEENKYIYFISYAHPFGFGNCELMRNKQIKNFQDILSISEDIAKKNKYEDIIILNFKELEKEG